MVHRRSFGPTPGMPPLTRESLAIKLRQNWLAKHPVDVQVPTVSLDDSLTSLSWLQNLNIMKIGAPTPPSSPPPLDQLRSQTINIPQFSSNTQVDPNAILNMTNLPYQVKQEAGLIPTTTYRTIGTLEVPSPNLCQGMDKIDYSTNSHVKPPYSYATLICMAMRESKKNKITLSGIYNWITEHFMYYRVADPSWQNSIRHNLSLNKCFQKVPRRKDEPGKGGFWRINPEYQDMFVNGIFKKRRCSPVSGHDVVAPPPLKKIRIENEDSNGSMASLSGLATVGAIPALLTPMNSMEEEPQLHHKSDTKLHNSFKYTGGDLSEGIDFSWNAILNQDIEVGGMKIKTEHIIDDGDPIASPITALSPPPSENSSDISLEDLLNCEFETDLGGPLDLTNGDALDLTVSGHGLKAPEWWNLSINGKEAFMSPGNQSRMSTPVAPSDTIDDSFIHPWAEDKIDADDAMDCFGNDFSNLFEMLENVPSPKLCGDS